MKLYSWKDVERHCLINRSDWGAGIEAIDVYPSEILVHRNKDAMQTTADLFKNLFAEKYSVEKNSVYLDLGNIELKIYEDDDFISSTNTIRPLFRDVLYHPTAYPDIKMKALSRQVIAFHSYKGGVGRTLSLIAFAKAWSSVFPTGPRSGLLLVDSDIEAPGLSWILGKPDDDTFSYLDLLTLIQDSNNIAETIELACSKLQMSTVYIETDTQKVEHIFMPTYRYREQLLDMYANPASLVNRREKSYILAEVLAGICEKLHLGTTLVDLRAGLSDFSSTLLFDPRVKKYLVTSTSDQSVRGIQTILEYLMKGLPGGKNAVMPEILLNMVVNDLPAEEKDRIIMSLTQYYSEEDTDVDFSADSIAEQVITTLPFASELVHLTNFKQILRRLDGREFYSKIRKLISENFKEAEQINLSETDRKTMLQAINRLADSQLTAESGQGMDILLTGPIKQLGKRFSTSIPTTVIMGSKGSGKTFLYQKMVATKDWSSFCENIYHSEKKTTNGFFLPTITPTTMSRDNSEELKQCIANINQSIESLNISQTAFLDGYDRLRRLAKRSDIDWRQEWESFLVKSLDSSFESFAQANQALEQKGKSVVFLIDGLEEIFDGIYDSSAQQAAIKELCTSVVNHLYLRYSNLGIVVFLRRDLARAAFLVNYVQFDQEYRDVSLKWSPDEALRLAVWLVSKAAPGFYSGDVGIEVASKEIIEEQLLKLWGLKLGHLTSKEAKSSNWILSALSDFNNQLQARDMIRFLKYATASVKPKPPYDDRLLMPAEIRSAISDCSKGKLDEVKEEYASLLPAIQKFEQLHVDQKYLPLDPQIVNLTSEEEKVMKEEGFLIRKDEKYYVPEIIRGALHLKYSKGARPKVLSLTK